MAESRTRAVGSGWTRFAFNGEPIAWARTVSDTAPRPVGGGSEDIHPMDKEHPAEIMVSRAVTSGTLTLSMYELWNQQVWETLPGFAGARTIMEVFKRQVESGDITCQKVIKSPDGDRIKNYYGCVITQVSEDETVDLNTLSVAKNVTIKYTHSNWI